MTSLQAGSLACVLAYFVGSLPFGLIVARLAKGIDIRKVGSGNIGATNVARTLGARWGALVLVLDALKGALPALLLPRLFFSTGDSSFAHVSVACGVATILGHMFPCWLGFRGGKGVATAFGVAAVLSPWGILAGAAAFALTFAVSRIVSLGSMIGSAVFAATQMALLWPRPFADETWSLATFSLFVPLLIVFRHRTNIGRIVRGEEPRLTFGAK